MSVKNNEIQEASGVVNFTNPITVGNESISQITLREIKTGDLRGIKLSDFFELDVDAFATVIPRISTPTLTAKDIYRLSLKDFNALAAGVNSFFIEN